MYCNILRNVLKHLCLYMTKNRHRDMKNKVRYKNKACLKRSKVCNHPLLRSGKQTGKENQTMDHFREIKILLQ